MCLFLEHHYKNNRHHPEHYQDSAIWVCDKCGEEFIDKVEGAECGVPISGTGTYCDGRIIRRHTLRGMNLIDIIEMFCDWLAATQRHADGDIMESIEKNQERFGYSDDIRQIFENTADLPLLED